jgi:hypothetical protein
VTTTDTDLQSRIRFHVHWGFVEIRNLAYSGGHDEQVAHLAAVLEFLPVCSAMNDNPISKW